MLGRLECSEGGWGKLRRDTFYGLEVLTARADPEGWLGEVRLRRAGRGLRRSGALQALAPKEFQGWPLLEKCGLRPVDPSPLIRAQCAPLAVEALGRRGVSPDRATVALRGLRADRDMARAAVQLCQRVRYLVVSAPRGGEELAQWLRREFGVPVLPAREQAQLALCFHPQAQEEEPAVLELFGLCPSLDGLRLSAPALAEADRENLPLLSALWERGKLGRDSVKIT